MDIVYGADVPSVARKVEKHLSIKAELSDDDKAEYRYFYEFDEMVRSEREEFERQKAIDDVS